MLENELPPGTRLVDEYGNTHEIRAMLDGGGQGVVYRTSDPDLAIKIRTGDGSRPVDASSLKQLLQSVRFLPLPELLPISLPLAVLKDRPGYVMSLFSHMSSFKASLLDESRRPELAAMARPTWLADTKDATAALRVMHYAQSGATKRRLCALAKVAAILARIHAAGLVYCDISPSNCYAGDGDSADVGLIDTDNLRFERSRGGDALYTPGYGAPEIVQGADQSRPRTDAWSFAVMAYQILVLQHPFIGKCVLEPAVCAGAWDADVGGGGAERDPDEQAYAGYLPFVDDEDDDCNRAPGGLPRDVVLTPALARLFQETFGAGRVEPWRRPAMVFWALELSRAHDLFIACPACFMGYVHERPGCPYCREPRPPIVLASTRRWVSVFQAGTDQVTLPHRMFHPFSLEMNAKPDYEAMLDFNKHKAHHVRGTKPLPAGLSFRFMEGGRP